MFHVDLLPSLKDAHHPRAKALAIQNAIDRLAERGGGQIILPPGEWIATSLELRSGICLHLARGCVLKAHGELSDYEQLERKGNHDNSGFHFIRAWHCENITLEGDGTIDGNDMAFWEEPLRDLKARGIDISEDLKRAPSHWPIDGPFWRGWKPRISPLIELEHCRHLAIRDLTIRNSPGWTVHPFCCDHVRIDGISIENHLYGPNTDGIDVNGCRDVYIANCRIVGCDDNIILKATKDARSCERVVVTNCTLKSNCAALGLGAETSSDLRDIAFSNCAVEQALRMIQFEMWEPGLIENVTISNIAGRCMVPDDNPMEKVIYMDIQQHRQQTPQLGHIRNVTISGIAATTKGRCILTAQDGAFMQDIVLRDIQLNYTRIEDAAKAAQTCRSTQNSNFNPIGQAMNAVVVAENVKRLRLENISAQLPAADERTPAFHGLYLRQIERAIVDCPWLTANKPGHAPLRQENCRELQIR